MDRKPSIDTHEQSPLNTPSTSRRYVDRLLDVEELFFRELTQEDWDERTIHSLLARLGETMDVCRVYRYRVDTRLGRGLVVQGWTRGDVASRFEENNHGLDEAKPLLDALAQQSIVCCSSPDDMEEPFRSMMLARQTRAFMLVPVRLQNRLVGALGVTDTRSNRTWQREEQRFLKRCAWSIGTALERRAMAESLTMARRAMAESEDIKQGFLATISHEVRNPLNAIIGLSSILIKDGAPRFSEQENLMVRYIRDSGEKLLEMMEDVLFLSRLYMEEWTVQEDHFNPVELLMELQIFMQGLLHGRADIQFELQYEGLPDHVLGDREALRRIVMHLLDNAVKFTGKGHVCLRAATDDAEYLRISVSDTGIGIPEVDREAIFKAFFQSGDVSTRRYNGVGLGLAVVRTLSDAIGASVEVKSQVGSGTEMILTVPLTKGEGS